MKKIVAVIVAVLVMTLVGTSVALADSNSQPASKATAQVTDIYLLEQSGEIGAAAAEYAPILTQTIKTANQQGLFVDVSLESGLYTDTLVKSKGANKDTSVASASIKVKVMVDEAEAYPGEVVFNYREQTLSATLQGILKDTNGNGVFDPEDVADPEEIQLILDTMSANSFNFVIDNLSSGIHTVTVLAAIDVGGSAQEGSYDARATIGKGSVAVESVRMIQDEDVILE